MSGSSGSKLFGTLMVFLKDFFEKVNIKKKFHRQQKSMQNYLACRVNIGHIEEECFIIILGLFFLDNNKNI